MREWAKIAVVGTGYWGRNYVRVLGELGVLAGICDTNQEQLKSLAKEFSVNNTYSHVEDVAKALDVAGVVVATPAETHFSVAKKLLEAGKNVLVEKPLSLNVRDAKELIQLAETKGRVLQVGHLLHFHPAVVALKELLASGVLGKTQYMYSNRVNLGKIRTEENILWSFAPHDISLMLAVVGELPVQAHAIGGSYLQPNVPDTTISSFLFPKGVRGHIFVSWLHPFKEQRFVVVGSSKMLVFDDCAAGSEKLLMYDRNVELRNGQFVAQKPKGEPVSFDTKIEPLRAQCEHFLESIQKGKASITDGREGLAVLHVLRACQRSLEMNGQSVQIKEEIHDR